MSSSSTSRISKQEVKMASSSLDIYSDEILILVRKYLKNDDLLKLRLISKICKTTVDKICEDTLKTWGRTSYGSKGNFELCPVTFYRSEKIQEFLQHMQTHPGNPFVGRSLTLVSGDCPDPPIFWNSVVILLKRFGNHIKKLTLGTMSPPSQDSFLFGPELYRILKYVPFIKELSIVGDNRYSNWIIPLNVVDIEVHPVLEQLEYATVVVLQDSGTAADNTLQILIKTCKHPEKLTHLNIHSIPKYLPSALPNVKVIHGNFSSEDWDIVGNNGWSLTELWGQKGKHVIPFKLDIIHKFQSTLCKLRLDSVDYTGQHSKEKIYLPVLKKLKIKYNHCEPIPVDCFSELKTLEEFILTDFDPQSLKPGSCETPPEITVIGNMYKSNIWNVLINLKIFRINYKIYRRKLHE